MPTRNPATPVGPKLSSAPLARIVGHGVAIALIILIWQVSVEFGLVREFAVSTPVRVLSAFVDVVISGRSWVAVGVTLSELAVGLALGGSVGILLGAAFASVRLLDRLFKPLILSFYTLPRIALLPLFIVWFGLGMGSKIAVVVIHGLVGFMLGAYATVSNIDRALVESCRVFGAGRIELLRLVYLPFSLPYLSTSARQVLGLAFGSVIVAEIAGAMEGIGLEISHHLARFDMTGVLAWIIFTSLLALVLDRGAVEIEKRAIRWRAPATGES